MPHLILEYSSNVIEKNTFPRLFEKCHGLLTESLPTERKSCTSRAIECSQFFVGENPPNAAFVHVDLNVKAGRTPEVLQKTGEALMAAIKEYCKESVSKLNLKVTLTITELPKTYFN